MKIQPIVEGHAEVQAVPILLRRFRDEAQVFEVEVNRPIRRNRTELVHKDSLGKAVRLALLRKCDGILILFDSDGDCPKRLAPQVQTWAASEAGSVPCAVVMATREYEAWLLAAIESLRGKRGIRADATRHPQPESPRNAKLQLSRSYDPTIDQAPLTAQFELAAAYAYCRSFRRMIRAFEILVRGAGVPLANWPPQSIARSTN